MSKSKNPPSVDVIIGNEDEGGKSEPGFAEIQFPGFGITSLEIVDRNYSGQIPDIGLTRENALKLAKVIQEHYGVAAVQGAV